MARKLTDIVSLSLRLREALRRRLERGAKKHNQSLNAEIVDRLDQSFELAERQAQYDALLSFAAAGNKFDARLLKLIASAMWKLRTGPKRLTDEEYAERLAIAVTRIIAKVTPMPWRLSGLDALRAAYRTMGRRVPGDVPTMPADVEALLVADAVLSLDGFKPDHVTLMSEARRLEQLDKLDQEKSDKSELGSAQPAKEPEQK